MDDSAMILCQISSLKDMLDQVNEEIEENIQVTRQIESEIVKCKEFETALAARESELTRTLYVSQFEIIGLVSVTVDSRKCVKSLEEELSCLKQKREEMLKTIDNKRERFTMLCQEFQREIDKGGNDELVNLLSEKELLENEVNLLDQKNNALKNSVLAFVEEVLQDLHDSNSVLHAEIQRENHENEKLVKDIDNLNIMLGAKYDSHQ